MRRGALSAVAGAGSAVSGRLGLAVAGREGVDRVVCGDCLAVLRGLPAGGVDCVVTSPPYFRQREYNGRGIGRESEVEEYLAALMAVLGEVVRVLKPRGNVFFNLGDKITREKGELLIPYRFALGAVAAYERLRLVNTISWVKKNPTPRQFRRRLVSATEPFFHFALGDDYYYALDEYLADEGVEAVGVPAAKSVMSAKLGERYFAMIDRSELSDAEKENARGELRRVVGEVRAGEIAGFRIKIRGMHAPAFGGQDGGRKIQMEKKGFTIIRLRGKKIKKDYIEMPVESLRYDVKHPAVYPLKLIEELVRLGCPPGGVVLDPFCGSGTSLVAARKNGRRYVGIDIDPVYCALAERRLVGGV